MYHNRKVSAILLAAGSGSRFGADQNKVYVSVGGRPMLAYSLEVLRQHPYVDEVIAVVREGEEKLLPGTFSLRRVTGGATRQESVLRGLEAAAGDIVVIHDGARPVIRPEFITRCVETMDEYSGCTTAVRSKDTVKLGNEKDEVTATTERSCTWIIQTPQCFRREVLLEAHRKFGGLAGITDDCMLLELAGEKVKLVEGDYTNIKVTTPEDRILAEAFLGRSGKGAEPYA